MEQTSRRTYDGDLLGQVFALLGRAFPWFPRQEAAAREHGLRWEEISTPFVVTDGGRVVSHVGLLEIQLVVMGDDVVVGAIHGVATDADERGKGHVRRLLGDALAWCESRYETVVLTTANPAVYESSGFRFAPEHRFVAEPPATGSASLRELDRSRPSDLALLHRLLRERAPVSRTLGVVRELSVFLFNLARTAVYYAEHLDAVVCYAMKGTTARLLDVVACEMPSLADVAACLPADCERIEAYFSPDVLGGDLTPEPHLLDGDDYLMVRGPFLPPDVPVMLPSPARC